MNTNFEAIKNKVIAKKQLLTIIDTWKSNNQKVVFTNGVFDLLHRGHIEYLAQTADFVNVSIIVIIIGLVASWYPVQILTKKYL